MSYKNLEIWQLAHKVVIGIHQMTLRELPKFEMYETGTQIRRSSKSIKSNIVEGFGRKFYQKDYLHFLIMAMASLQETMDHMDTLFETGSLKNEKLFESTKQELNLLGKKINCFIQTIQSQL